MGIATIQPVTTQTLPDSLELKADQVLARKAAAGDRLAFQEIVNSHKQRMFTVARSVVDDPALAEDVVQEAFIKAYRALTDFRGDARLATWLFRITYLAAIDNRRQTLRHLRLATDSADHVDTPDASSHSRGDLNLESHQLGQQIDAALQKLSPFEKTVFTLRHMQNFKLREIAQVVDRSEGTVKNILFRAIRKMREHLAGTHFAMKDMEIERC